MPTPASYELEAHSPTMELAQPLDYDHMSSSQTTKSKHILDEDKHSNGSMNLLADTLISIPRESSNCLPQVATLPNVYEQGNSAVTGDSVSSLASLTLYTCASDSHPQGLRFAEHLLISENNGVSYPAMTDCQTISMNDAHQISQMVRVSCTKSAVGTSQHNLRPRRSERGTGKNIISQSKP